MDHVSLNRKLKTFIGDGGYFRGVSPEVLFELLVAWENWVISQFDVLKLPTDSHIGYTSSRTGPSDFLTYAELSV